MRGFPGGDQVVFRIAAIHQRTEASCGMGGTRSVSKGIARTAPDPLSFLSAGRHGGACPRLDSERISDRSVGISGSTTSLQHGAREDQHCALRAIGRRASVRAASIYARRPMHVGQKVCASMNAHTRSIASKTIPPRLCMAMVLSALVWLGGPRSADAGVDVWTPTGPPSGTILALAIDPQNPATLYAAVSRDSVFPNSAVTGVFKSTDGGATWGAAGLTIPTSSLVIDPLTPTTLYAAGSSGVFKSADGGGTWSAVNSGLPTPSLVRHLAIDPQTPTTLYASRSSDGIYKSTDGGGTWVTTGLTIRTNSVVTIDPSTPTNLYAASVGDPVIASGVFKSTDDGGTWSTTGLTLPTRSLAIDPQTPTTLYAGAGGPTDGGVFKSIDGGASWTAVNTGLTDLVINALAVDPRVSTTVYAGTSRGGIFKSTDGGGTWSAVNAGLRPDRGPSGWPSDLSGHPSVLAFAIDPQTSSTIYTGISFSGVFKSSDGGGSWRGVGPTIADVRAITVDPEIPTTLYLGTALSGVFRSTDGGGSWVGITPTLMSVLSASQMAIDPRN